VFWLLREWRRRARTRDSGSSGRPGEEDDRAGPAHQRGGEVKVGWAIQKPLGRLASGLAWGRGEVGLRLGQKPEMGQSSKRNSFRISIDFGNLAEVWKIAQGDL
jgi:hypothetical protein